MEASQTGSQETREPTQGEAIQVGTAGAQAVDPNTQTPEQARQASQEAMQEKARELKITLAPGALKEMSNAFISALEERGAFRQSEDTSSQSQQTQQTNTNVEESAPPQNKSWAAKFLGS
jgi:hypothetical protein